MTQPEAEEFVTIKTSLPTLPLPANTMRPILTTDRLLIRPLASSDLEALHTLRTQPEVMKWTTAGRIDHDLKETHAKLDLFLPPNDTRTANCAICLKGSGEFIGIGGCHLYPGCHGWPEIGYMLQQEVWGRGLATEFLSVWLPFWGRLSRSEREMRVRRDMLAVSEKGDANVVPVVRERLVAITEASNLASQKVLLKAGFESFCGFAEVDATAPGGTVQLVAFCYFV
ncbi:hypothetical protein NUU61_005766 [Penicillium alfredii]|uniref:N-acetyltransferase domain-containing protein n=1 Tax=Penicillium alfredii TaxID=1506179 RepID=A0A9W9FA09_9EURO|nr:uncharacterized protein NUU61_005766 [Penicillium alfredii]KAJ5096410.1 hypothetical protein NUU61_005766 [Penicillium alfredii]